MRLYGQLLAALGLASMIPAGAVWSQGINDAQIEREVAWLMQTDPYIGGDLVRVEVESGIVYLSGNLTTPWECRRALELAARVPGVRGVVNNIPRSPLGNPLSYATPSCRDVGIPD